MGPLHQPTAVGQPQGVTCLCAKTLGVWTGNGQEACSHPVAHQMPWGTASPGWGQRPPCLTLHLCLTTTLPMTMPRPTSRRGAAATTEWEQGWEGEVGLGLKGVGSWQLRTAISDTDSHLTWNKKSSRQLRQRNGVLSPAAAREWMHASQEPRKNPGRQAHGGRKTPQMASDFIE